MQFHGTVSRQQVAAASKSEHAAVVLLTAEGPLKLRRVGGNPFKDPELEKLVGCQIKGEGEVHAGQLMLSEWEVL